MRCMFSAWTLPRPATHSVHVSVSCISMFLENIKHFPRYKLRKTYCIVLNQELLFKFLWPLQCKLDKHNQSFKFPTAKIQLCCLCFTEFLLICNGWRSAPKWHLFQENKTKPRSFYKWGESLQNGLWLKVLHLPKSHIQDHRDEHVTPCAMAALMSVHPCSVSHVAQDAEQWLELPLQTLPSCLPLAGSPFSSDLVVLIKPGSSWYPHDCSVSVRLGRK